jgi:DNA-binding winged helix-turn-helix (wHTH) protein
MPGDLGEGRYVFDVDAFELRRDGQPVDVEPQVLEVLRHLVEHPNQLVRKEELLDEVWGDRFVSESALSSRIKAARQATGDDGRRQAVIRTVHGKGFTFVAEVV